MAINEYMRKETNVLLNERDKLSERYIMLQTQILDAQKSIKEIELVITKRNNETEKKNRDFMAKQQKDLKEARTAAAAVAEIAAPVVEAKIDGAEEEAPKPEEKKEGEK